MRLKKLFIKNTLIYLLSSIVVGIIPFILLPILTNILKPEALGKIGFLEFGIAFSFPLISLGLHGALNVEFFNRTKEEFSIYVFSVSVLPIFVATLIILTLWLSYLLFGFESALPIDWLLLIPVIAVSQFFYQAWLIIVQCEKRPITYGIMQFIMVLLNFGLSLIFIIALHMGAEGRLYGIFIAFSVVGMVSIYMLRRNAYLIFKFKLSYVYEALKYGLPLIPHLIGGMSMVYLDRYFITDILGTEKLGIYVVAVQIAFSLIFLQNALNQAMIPFVFEKLSLNNEDGDKVVGQIFSAYIFFMSIATVALCASSRYIYQYFIGSEYSSSQEFVKYLALSMLVLASTKIYINILLYEKKTHFLSLIAIILLLLGWTMFRYFIELYGLKGAALTSLILSLVTLLLVGVLASKYRNIKLRIRF